MQDRHVPALTTRYWFAFTAATVFGANAGDTVEAWLSAWTVAELYLHLPLLLLVYVGTLVIERFDLSETHAWYWLAVVVALPASNELGDVAALQMGIGRSGVFALLLVVLAVSHLMFRTQTTWLLALHMKSRRPRAVPLTDAAYWIALVMASTAGALANDYFAFTRKLDAPVALVALSAGVAVAIALYFQRRVSRILSYWLLVVALSAFGNAAGRLLMEQPSLGRIGSVILSGVVLAALLATLRMRRTDSELQS